MQYWRRVVTAAVRDKFFCPVREERGEGEAGQGIEKTATEVSNAGRSVVMAPKWGSPTAKSLMAGSSAWQRVLEKEKFLQRKRGREQAVFPRGWKRVGKMGRSPGY